MVRIRHIACALASVGGFVAGADGAAGVQRLTAAPCPVIRLAESIARVTVRCASVEVPQARDTLASPDLAPVRLTVVIFSRGDTTFHATPVLYLTGGPGESAIDDVSINLLGTPTGQALIRERPIIAFDQRGFDADSRESSPWLGGLRRAQADTSPLHASQLYSVLETVSSSLRARGVDLRNFNTIEAAHDAADVVRALGFGRVILFGSSYGTRVAFHILKEYGDMIEAAVLDGPVPPQATAAFHLDSANAYRRRAVKRLVHDCREDPQCRTMYPRIEKDWWRLAHPGALVRVKLMDMVSGDTVSAVVRGDDLIAAIGGYLILEEFRIATPAILSQLTHDVPVVDASSGVVPAALRLGSGVTMIPEYGLGYLSVICADAPMGIPQYGGHGVCDALGVPFGGGRHVEPVRTTVPTLLLVARYDAATPPEWADLAVRRMSAAHVVTVPGIGHGAHTQPHSRACVATVITTFIQSPNSGPDIRCIDALGLPAFPEPPARASHGGRDPALSSLTPDAPPWAESSDRRTPPFRDTSKEEP